MKEGDEVPHLSSSAAEVSLASTRPPHLGVGGGEGGSQVPFGGGEAAAPRRFSDRLRVVSENHARSHNAPLAHPASSWDASTAQGRAPGPRGGGRRAPQNGLGGKCPHVGSSPPRPLTLSFNPPPMGAPRPRPLSRGSELPRVARREVGEAAVPAQPRGSPWGARRGTEPTPQYLRPGRAATTGPSWVAHPPPLGGMTSHADLPSQTEPLTGVLLRVGV